MQENRHYWLHRVNAGTAHARRWVWGFSTASGRYGSGYPSKAAARAAATAEVGK